jgi:hypothetical protein
MDFFQGTNGNVRPIAWGSACSLALHILVMLLILIGYPALSGAPKPESPEPLHVDLVPADLVPIEETTTAPRAVRKAALPQEKAPPTVKPVPARVLTAPAVKTPTPQSAVSPTPDSSFSEDGLGSSNVTTTADGAAAGQHAGYGVKDFIRAQIERHWNFNVGALGGANIAVSLHLILDPDGSVRSVDIVADPRYASDRIYREAADSIRRAVLVASPLQLPPGRYEDVEDLTLTFNPQDAAR